MADNPVRPCWGCETFDSDPRHVIVLDNGTDEPMHVDCCADKRGCQVCAGNLAGITPGTTGEALREHLLSLPPQHILHVPNGDHADPYDLTTVTEG